MNIKKGDKVKVMVGKDKGKDGQVNQVFPKENRLVVEGVNKIFKHMKARQGGKGSRIELFGPIAGANAMLICPKCAKTSRVGHKLLENGDKVRVCKKCKETI